MRREIATLRDTTTRFDMSFDAALHRVEQRLEGLEQAETVAPPLFVPTSTGSNYHTTAESETIEQAVVRLR